MRADDFAGHYAMKGRCASAPPAPPAILSLPHAILTGTAGDIFFCRSHITPIAAAAEEFSDAQCHYRCRQRCRHMLRAQRIAAGFHVITHYCTLGLAAAARQLGHDDGRASHDQICQLRLASASFKTPQDGQRQKFLGKMPSLQVAHTAMPPRYYLAARETLRHARRRALEKRRWPDDLRRSATKAAPDIGWRRA